MDPTLDRFDIIDTTVRMAWHADRREWDSLNDVLAPRVRLDYTSLNGGEAATVERGDITAAWRNGLGGLTATQHLVSNHLVAIDGDQATCTAAFQATHVLANPLGEPTWTLGGHYRFELTLTSVGWRIAAVTMTADWATGNQQIMTLAVAR